MPADVVDLLSSSPTASGTDIKSVVEVVNPVRDAAPKGQEPVRREESDEPSSSWPTSSDMGGLVMTRNLDLGGERSPKRRKLQQMGGTTTNPRLRIVNGLSAVNEGKRTRRSIELDSASDSDPFASSPTGGPRVASAPAEKSLSPDTRAQTADRDGLKKRTASPNIPPEVDPFSSSFPDIDVLPNRVAVSASQAPNQNTKSTRASAEILSSPTYPPVDDTLARLPDPAASPILKKVTPERVPSPNSFSSSPLPDVITRKPLEAARPDVCRISSSPEPGPRSRTKAPPEQTSKTENPASDPFASSPIADPSHQPSAEANVRTREAPSARRPTSRQLQNFDPISSSAPEPSKTPNPPKKRVITIDGSDSDPNKSSDDDLPSLADLRNFKPRASTSLQRSRSDTYASNSKVPKRTTTATATTNSKPKRSAEEKERLRLERQKAKEADREAKKLATEEKKKVAALEKAKSAALAEVNKLKTDKKDSTQEMIVDLPSGLDEGLRISAQTVLEGLEPAPQHTVYESQISNVVKFRRKVNSRYDEALRYWVPCPARIEDEGHILVIIDADEFVNLAQDGLNDFVSRVEAVFPAATKVYLLQGIATWKKKNRTLQNRQFASGVRGEPEASTARRRKTPAKEPIDEDIIEDAMLQLQVEHSALIHHTTTPPDTASWISTFTQHISTIPYRHRRDADLRTANFCMDSGQVKTGENPRDTYVKMLGEIGRVTDGIAYGVAEEFPSVGRLVRGLEREGGMERLGEVRKASNRNGAFSDMRIGAAMGRRFWHIFTGRDEDSTDV